MSQLVAPRHGRALTMTVALSGALAAAAVTSPLAVGSTRVLSVADAHMAGGKPAGAAPVLRFGPGRRVAFLRFSPAGVRGPRTTATLRLYKRSRPAAAVAVRRVRGKWPERLLERSGRPRLGARIAVTSVRRGRGWIKIDVTKALRRRGVVDLALTTPSRAGVVVASRESGKRRAPRLVLRTLAPGAGAGGGQPGAGAPGGSPSPGSPGSPSTPTSPVTPGDPRRPYDASSPWNTPIPADVAVDPLSAVYMTSIANNNLPLTSDPDQYAIPVYLYDSSTPRQTVEMSGYFSSYDAGDSSRKGYGFAPTITNVPIPANAVQSEGSDGQIVIWDPVSGTEYSFWQFDRQPDGTYIATNGYRYHTGDGYFGRFADGLAGRGAGTPYFAGLVRKWEADQGRIEHALAFAYDSPSAEFRFPASKSDGGNFGGVTGADLPEGARLQLDPVLSPAQIVAWGCTGACLTIARALQDYGMYVIDHSGSSKIYLEDRMTAGWPSSITRDLVKNIPWSAFRVVAAPAQP